MSTTPQPTYGGRPQEASGCPIRHHSADGATPAAVLPRIATAIYGAITYALFLAVFLYAIGFVADVVVPRTMDRAVESSVGQAVVIDLGLLTLFAVQHSVMARPVFKRWWTRYVPEPIERSTYVLFASAALALVCWQWRSIDAVVWSVDAPVVRTLLAALGFAGWAIVLASTFMIDHFELFGLRQVLHTWRSQPLGDTGFRTILLYRVVRHPLMLGFLIAFWSTPTMTAGHLLFAVATTAYILVALQLEERDLIDALGERYRRYREQVPMLFPRLWR